MLLEDHLVDPSRELVVEVARHIELKNLPIVAAAHIARAAYLVTYDRQHVLRRDLVELYPDWSTVTPDVVVAALHPRGSDAG